MFLLSLSLKLTRAALKPSRGRGRALSSSNYLYRLMKRRKEGVAEVNWVVRELSRSAVWV